MWRGSIRVGCSLCLRFLPGLTVDFPHIRPQVTEIDAEYPSATVLQNVLLSLIFPLSSHYTFGGAF